ncbi:hypothetical protein REC12_25350 [Desulfosporosinus sp. PR]|uniref:hypothetical protein n=1 Tax=Candidatus Desulfosporosinus nitrosoreducens TaxID=3401928 RepID=UPI0027ED537B|nr:hypothetical protein [Desulfosporosinus sp. PR]MDQ7096926.1 hypothetical protein [Desulfosporosinus sp. PR]
MEHLWPEDINFERDILIKTTDVNIIVNHSPSRHVVQTFEVKNGPYAGRKYHIFCNKKGCSIANYHPKDYAEMLIQLVIEEKDTIFEQHKGKIYLVPNSYRQELNYN